jgi:translation initiation factor 2B subunit (eIF-2B alpha/beta/delta family)
MNNTKQLNRTKSVDSARSSFTRPVTVADVCKKIDVVLKNQNEFDQKLSEANEESKKGQLKQVSIMAALRDVEDELSKQKLELERMKQLVEELVEENRALKQKNDD